MQALPWAESEAAVRRTLLAAGFHEAIASTFCSAAEAALTAPQPGLVVPLGNPLSEEAGVLRPSLVPGMLAMIAGNLHRDVSDVRLFELGTVFSGTTEKVEERPALAFGAAGALPEQSALHPARAIDFHDVKGVVEQVLARFQTRAVYFDRFPAEAGLTPAWLHPYRSARVVADGVTVGWFGQLHPREAAARKLKEPVLRRRALSRPALQAAAAQARRRGRSRASSRCGAIFRWSWTRALRGRRSIERWRGCRFPSWWTGGRARSFATRSWARTNTRCCWAPPSRPPDRTLREEELQSFQARWWRLLAKQARGCAREPEYPNLDPGAILAREARHLRGGYIDVGIILGIWNGRSSRQVKRSRGVSAARSQIGAGSTLTRERR